MAREGQGDFFSAVFTSGGKGPTAITGGRPGTISPELNAVSTSVSKAGKVLIRIPWDRGSARLFSTNWVVKRLVGSRRGSGREEFGILTTPAMFMSSEERDKYGLDA